MPLLVNNLMLGLTIALILFGPLVVGWWLGRREKRVAAVALRLGWLFTPETADGDDERFHGFEVFERGYDRLALNTLQGAIEITTGDGQPRWLAVIAGDFQYKEKGNKGQEITQRFSYLMAELPSVWRGEIAIRPEGKLDKCKSAMGFDDIDFESAEFSDRFHVTASNKRFAYDVLHPRMMELFLDAEPPHVAVRGNRLCLTERDRLMGLSVESLCDPLEFPEWIGFTRGFLELWPRHLCSAVEVAAR